MASNSVHSESGEATSLIGRAREVAEIQQLLATPQCRLLTLIGPGGIGKTRLALEVITNLIGYTDGVYFIALQPLPSPDLLAPAIATVAGLALAGNEPLTTQLINNLRHKQMLLLLDNFEHLLAASDLLVDLLQAAPAVTLLVTSRAAIGVREEWLYPVHGLSVPLSIQGSIQEDEQATYGALELFQARARQVQHDFRWEREQEAVVSICRQVEGNPLAVELAASWLNVLPCAAIAAQIRQGLDILASQHRNIPTRHRSMRAVFDGSWQLLSQAERTIFSRITVFRGGFALAAAQAIAQASLAEVSALVSKSLLRRTADGRYQVHELLRQYGAEILARLPTAVTAIQRVHADYFLAYLYERRPRFDGPEQQRTLGEIDVEYENLHAALLWAVAHFQTDTQATAIRRALSALTSYYQVRGRYLEGAELLADVTRQVERVTRAEVSGALLAECLTCSGWLAIRLGRLDAAKAALTRAIELYDQQHLPPPEFRAGHPKMAYIFLALALGEYEHALRLGEEMRHITAQANQPAALALACYGSACAALAQGQYGQARQYGEEALALRLSLGMHYHTVAIHDLLGQVAITQDELTTAKRHFEAAYALSVTLEAHGGMALHLKNLGDVAARQQRWQEAYAYYGESHTRFQAIGDRGGIADAERGLAITAYHLGDLIRARHHFRQALDVVVAIKSVRIMLTVLTSAGIFMIDHANSGRGFALGQQILRFVIHHPTCDHVTYAEASQFLRQRGISQEDTSGNTAGNTIEALAAALQAELVTAGETSASLPPAQSLHIGLVDPLTDRELEIVRLLAAGYSNAEIARELVIATGTVKAHTSNIYRKLDVTTRAQAVSRLHTFGLLD